MTSETIASISNVIQSALRFEGRDPTVGYFDIGSDLEIARFVLADLESERGSIVFTEGNFYAYDGSRWEVMDETALKRRLNKYDGWRYGIEGVVRMNDRKMVSILRSVATEREQRDFFFRPPAGINVENGFLTIEPDGTPKLISHDRDHRQRHVLRHKWNHEADWTVEAPLLNKLLNGSFEGDEDKKGKIDLVAEIIGATVLGIATNLTEPKAFVLHGRSAGNGKSQVLDCIRGLLPREAVQSISPSDFDDDRKVIHLSGALLNATDELGTAQAIASDRFKAIITGDPVTAREVFKPAAQFKPQALHVFATNTLPAFRGGFDRGVQRRLMVVPFNRTIPEAERVPHLGDLIVKTEGAQLLAFAVDGASRLIRQGHFTDLPSSLTALRDWIVGADPVIAWMDERVQFDREAVTRIKVAYSDFKEWALQQGFDKFHLPAINNFSQRVYAEDSRIGKGPRNTASGRTFLGLRLVEHRKPMEEPEIPF